MKTVKLARGGARLIAAAEPAVTRAQDRFLSRLPVSEGQRFMSTLSQLVELNNEFSRVPLRLVANLDQD